MTRRRSLIATAFGTINLLLGSLGLIMTAGSLAVAIAGYDANTFIGSFMSEEFQKQTSGFTNQEMLEYQARIPGAETGKWFGIGIDALLSLLLIVSGIGLLRMAPWGRWLTIVYAGLNLAIRSLAVYWVTTVLNPALVEFFQQKANEAATPQQKMQCEFQMWLMPTSTVVGTLILFIYPLIVLVFMLLPSVGRAFRGIPEPEPPLAPEDEEDFDEWTEDHAVDAFDNTQEGSMTSERTCNVCGELLRTPDLSGTQPVACPHCGALNPPVSAASAPAPAPSGAVGAAPSQPRESAATTPTGRPAPRGPRRDREPHRGPLILALGVVSEVCVFLFAPLGIPLGLAAWVMGTKDLRRMRAGEMDRQGEGYTLAGKISGIIGTIMSSIVTIFIVLYVVFVILVLTTVMQNMPKPAPSTAPAKMGIGETKAAPPDMKDSPAPQP